MEVRRGHFPFLKIVLAHVATFAPLWATMPGRRTKSEKVLGFDLLKNKSTRQFGERFSTNDSRISGRTIPRYRRNEGRHTIAVALLPLREPSKKIRDLTHSTDCA